MASTPPVLNDDRTCGFWGGARKNVVAHVLGGRESLLLRLRVFCPW